MSLPRESNESGAERRLKDALNAQADELQRVVSFSWRLAGTAGSVRWEASRATDFVQFHVQHTGVGGGGANYNASTFVESTEVDCRSNRIQDDTVTLNGVDHYYVWLIPVFKDPHAGTAVKFDGQGGRADYSVYMDLGV